MSDITQLAANPPKYPRNPTEQIRDPFSLYIARVPGSRDLVLTPLKPQPKNVTAEDVSSSLYYLHLNTEADGELLATSQSSIPEEVEPDEVPRKPLPRKPLPHSARSSLDINQRSQANHLEDAVQADNTIKSKPLLPERKPILPIRPSLQLNEGVQRKPLGPRPLVSQSVGRKPLLGDGRILNSNFQQGTPSAYEVESSSLEASPSDDFDKVDDHHRTFSITIIRRDPSSGAQWNVGTLVGEEQTESNPARSRKSYFDISILLSTPGYGQFKTPLLIQQYNRSRSSSGGNPPGHALLSDVNDRSENPHDRAISGSGFVRHLCMEGSSFWARTRQHKRSQSDAAGTRGIAGGANSNFGGDAQNETFQGHGAEDPIDFEPKGYVFTSPWDGRCKFSTTSGGKSLRCRHTLPGPISANGGGELSSPVQNSALVSELRFNLPSSTVFSSHASSSAAKALVIESRRLSKQKLGHIRNKLSPEKIISPPLPPRMHPTSYAAMYPSDGECPPLLPPRPQVDAYATESSDEGGETHATTASEQAASWLPGEDEPRLDLSIGREKAGGGNKGKHAKLGKLVIYDEGFKMLDLIVAANMGVWWSVWGSD